MTSPQQRARHARGAERAAADTSGSGGAVLRKWGLVGAVLNINLSAGAVDEPFTVIAYDHIDKTHTLRDAKGREHAFVALEGRKAGAYSVVSRPPRYGVNRQLTLCHPDQVCFICQEVGKPGFPTRCCGHVVCQYASEDDTLSCVQRLERARRNYDEGHDVRISDPDPRRCPICRHDGSERQRP